MQQTLPFRSMQQHRVCRAQAPTRVLCRSHAHRGTHTTQRSEQQPSSSPQHFPLSLPALAATSALGLALIAGPASAMDPDTMQHAALATGSAAAQQLYDLAGEQEFWSNVARYGRYFVTVMLGTGYVMVKPLAGMFKNPVSAVLGTAGLVGAAVLTKLTLEAMLGTAGDPFEGTPFEFNYDLEDNMVVPPAVEQMRLS